MLVQLSLTWEKRYVMNSTIRLLFNVSEAAPPCPFQCFPKFHSLEVVVGGDDVYRMACFRRTWGNPLQDYTGRSLWAASSTLLPYCCTDVFHLGALPMPMIDNDDIKEVLVVTQERLSVLPHWWVRYASKIHSCNCGMRTAVVLL